MSSIPAEFVWAKGQPVASDGGVELPEPIGEAVCTVRIPPLAYLRAMGNLFWSAIRHPLSETTIDLSTGRVLYRG
jgi:hypothetical protein